MPRHYFNEIVGLRFYLALWVALDHGLETSGILTSHNFMLKEILRGDAAVQLFMIISGFVITSLIMGKHENYLPYIIRRFFRLYPAFILGCVCGFLVMGSWVMLSNKVPWAGSDYWASYRASISDMAEQTLANTLPHLLAHATMLHGGIPDQLLHRSAMTFLPAAWSISLEWQFYLVAPLVLFALRSPRATVILAAVTAIAYAAQSRGLLGTYELASCLCGSSGFFAIGIGCRLAYDSLSQLRCHPLPIAAISCLLLMMFAQEPLALYIWCCFFAYLVWAKHAGPDAWLFRQVFLSHIPQRLGEASYSLYLIHRPIQVLAGLAALSWTPLTHARMFGAMCAATCVGMIVSLFMYRFVERPGMRFGAALANRFPVLA